MTRKKNTQPSEGRPIIFEEIEGWVRGRIQDWIQDLLEEEVTELLGGGKSQRRAAVDGPGG